MRIILNTSFIIEEKIEAEWVEFIRQRYIAPIREKQLCEDIIFTKVSIDQPEGKTYSIQLVFTSPETLFHFQENYLPSIEEELILHYSNRYFCFSSILTEI